MNKRSHAAQLTLADGTRLAIRRARPEDRQRIVDGFARLSPQSRYNRFFSTKSGLSEAELTAFTEFDGNTEMAVGAVRLAADGSEQEGVGIARFYRDPDHPKVADVAVVVMDDMQGQGIGRALIEYLAKAAADVGIRRFRGRLLADNETAIAALTAAAPELELSRDGDLIRAEFPLPAAPERLGGSIRRLLKLCAIRQVGANISRWLHEEQVADTSTQRLAKHPVPDREDPPETAD